MSRFIDSARRHLNDYLMIAQYKRDGIPLENLPEDVNPNEDHLVAAYWNLHTALHHEELHPEMNDLVPQEHVEIVAQPVEEESGALETYVEEVPSTATQKLREMLFGRRV